MLGGAGEATNFGFILLMEAVLGFFSGFSLRFANQLLVELHMKLVEKPLLRPCLAQLREGLLPWLHVELCQTVPNQTASPSKPLKIRSQIQ